jgi:galactokinase/mevalonate kinase-like predicted kinase
MSTSTRNAAKKMWPHTLPLGKPEKLAEMLFKFENNPGSQIISGAQDSIGICMPGLVRHYYDNAYWPLKIESIHDDDILNWLEKHIYMVLLWPRPQGLDLLGNTNINSENVKKLAGAAEQAWDAILKKDLEAFATAYLDSFNAQTTLFPSMMNQEIEKVIESYKPEAMAWKLAGAGGGGYLILVSEKPVRGAMSIKIRRKDSGI